MATTYDGWVADGRPWKPARPIESVAQCLRGHGYTVYILGNYEHQTAIPPEDHVPYSHTPWPGRQPYPFVLALDIMPPPPGSGLPSLAQLGEQMVTDRMDNHPGMAWLKYINWEPNGATGQCVQDSWQPTHQRTWSTDRGHIHGSGRTDYVTSDAADHYDPVARIRGEDVSEMFPVYGDKGEGVKRRQRQMVRLGCTIGPDNKIDGIYGPTLAAAVKKYRADRNADPVGEGKVISAWQVDHMEWALNLLAATKYGKPGPPGDPGEPGPPGTITVGTVLALDAHNATVTAVTPAP